MDLASVGTSGAKGANPLAVTLLAVGLCLAGFVFGMVALVDPVKVAKAQARYRYRRAVISRKGRETVLPEYVWLLQADTPEEALDKLRRAIDDPEREIPHLVLLSRLLGLAFTLFCGFVLLLFVGGFLGWFPPLK